jgi:histidinol-phosphate aminotransferase
MIAAKEHIQRLRAYEPGKQPREGEQVIKLNTNENPYPPSPWVLEAIREEATSALRLYPDPLSQRLREAAASVYGVLPGQVLCGNGSDELLGILLRTFTNRGDRIGFYDPSYSYYRTLGSVYDLEQRSTPLGRDFTSPPLPTDPDLALFFLTNPHSPLGFSLRPEFVSRLARHLRGILVVDEAYADFARWNCLSLLREFPNVVITRSLSKSYSLAGLRVGLALAAEPHIAQMHKARDHYNLNRVSQAAATVALRDQGFFEENRRRILRTRDRFIKALHALGLETVSSDANFAFVRFPSSSTASRVYQAMTARGILVRHFEQDGLSDGLRITVGTDRDMDRLLAQLGSLLREP